MSTNDEIGSEINNARDLRWLVTAGPTREDIDPVRFISNRSSGRMGYAIARAAHELGGSVTLVSGPVALDAPEGCELVRVRSARELRDEVVARARSADVVVMAAAVADFRPKAPAATKIDKSACDLVIELERTDDILAGLGSHGEGRVLVGFALESPPGGEVGVTESMRERARAKREAKRLAAIVLNAPAAMDSGRSTVSVLPRAGGWDAWGDASKESHAKRLVELAAGLAAGGK